MLDQKSFEALLLPPLPPVGAIRFATDFSPEEIGQSAVARNALILLHSASVGPGLKLTTTGNLSRSVVAEMCDLFTWPGFDKTEAFRLHKVINEPDFLPLYFVRHLVETAGLVRQRKGYLKTTPADPDKAKCWRHNGTLGPWRWKQKFFDRYGGLGFLNIGKKRLPDVASRHLTSTARRRY